MDGEPHQFTWINPLTGEFIKNVSIPYPQTPCGSAINRKDNLMYLCIGSSIIAVDYTTGKVSQTIPISDLNFMLYGYDEKDNVLVGTTYGGLIYFDPVVVTINLTNQKFNYVIYDGEFLTTLSYAGYDPEFQTLFVS
jgi:hypothetical protein